jgi:excisionase family DNA binding protein
MSLNEVTSEVSDAGRRRAEDWRADSLCRKHPTRWWFGGDQRETTIAKGLCAGCVVQLPCLEFALGRPELLGVWAATTPGERAAMRRAGGAPVPATPVDVHVDVHGEHDGGPRRARPRRGRERPSELADGDELLTPAEAARRLGVTANTVTRWSRAGKIAAVHTVGGHRRFRSSEVERVLLGADVVVPASR